jgi:hypothetical protein
MPTTCSTCACCPTRTTSPSCATDRARRAGGGVSGAEPEVHQMFAAHRRISWPTGWTAGTRPPQLCHRGHWLHRRPAPLGVPGGASWPLFSQPLDHAAPPPRAGRRVAGPLIRPDQQFAHRCRQAQRGHCAALYQRASSGIDTGWAIQRHRVQVQVLVGQHMHKWKAHPAATGPAPALPGTLATAIRAVKHRQAVQPGPYAGRRALAAATPALRIRTMQQPQRLCAALELAGLDRVILGHALAPAPHSRLHRAQQAAGLRGRHTVAPRSIRPWV